MLTGFWIVSFVILSATVPIGATELQFAIMFWIGTAILIVWCIRSPLLLLKRVLKGLQ